MVKNCGYEYIFIFKITQCISRANPIKLFAVVIYWFSQQARVLVPAKPFQPSQMFTGKARPYPKKHLSGVPI